MSHRIRHDTVARRITIDTTVGADVVHRCLAGPLCKATEMVDNKRRSAPTEKPDSVCRRCYSAIRIAVEDLPGDREDLINSIGEHQHIPGEKVHASQGHSAPIDSAKHDLAREISQQLIIAAARVHTARNSAGEPPKTAADCSALVAKHLDLLITSPERLEEEWCGAGESVLSKDVATGKPRYIPNIRIISRPGIDTAMRLVDLRRRARARLAGVSTDMWQLPAHLAGCLDCGERLYTNGHKIMCRACNRDWTEQNGGLFNAEIKRRAEIEKQERMDTLEYLLAEAQHQRDTANARLDRFQRFLNEIGDLLPAGVGLGAQQLNQLLAPILEGHPGAEEHETEGAA